MSYREAPPFTLEAIRELSIAAKRRVESWPKWKREVTKAVHDIGCSNPTPEEKILFIDQYRRNLLKACQDLHLDLTGASDNLSLSQRIELICFLDAKLKNWDNTKSSPYDLAVKHL